MPGAAVILAICCLLSLTAPAYAKNLLSEIALEAISKVLASQAGKAVGLTAAQRHIDSVVCDTIRDEMALVQNTLPRKVVDGLTQIGASVDCEKFVLLSVFKFDLDKATIEQRLSPYSLEDYEQEVRANLMAERCPHLEDTSDSIATPYTYVDLSFDKNDEVVISPSFSSTECWAATR